MSVEQINIVDFIGVDKRTGQAILTISDHLDWDSNDEHLLILQNKINAYLNFIESGELIKNYPDAINRQAVIKVLAKYEPDTNGLKFLAEAKKIIEGAGFGFEFKHSP
jgi:hypothetical protein